MAGVQTVLIRRTSGDPVFNRNLRAALQARGLRFTSDKKRADAFLDMAGRGQRDGGFVGEMTFIGRGGRVLQREKAIRPPGSRAMAYRTLAQKVRFRRR